MSTPPPISIEPRQPIHLIPAENLISDGSNKKIFGERKLKGKYENMREKGISAFANGNYDEAYKNFKNIRDEAIKDKNKYQHNLSSEDALKLPEALQALKAPEILIYQNNAEARLRHNNKGEPIYTIAVATPISDKDERLLPAGQQILFGVAMAQNKYNHQKKGTNLEIIIANDLNNEDQAKEVAKSLSEDNLGVLAVMGHYTSPVTCAALPYYDSAGLVVISSTSSRSDQRKECKVDKFFRTTTTNTLEATSLANYVNTFSRHENVEPKIFAFYKKGEGFSQDLLQRFKEALSTSLKVEILREIDLSNQKAVIEAISSSNKANIFAVFPDGETGNLDAYDRAIDVIKNSKKIKLILGSNPLYKEKVASIDNLKDKSVLSVDWYSKCSNQDFIASANEIWSGDVNRFTALSYEAVQALLSAFEIHKGKVLEKDLYTVHPQSDVFKNKNISFDEKGDRKDISSRILVTPNKSSHDSFDLIDGQNCEN